MQIGNEKLKCNYHLLSFRVMSMTINYSCIDVTVDPLYPSAWQHHAGQYWREKQEKRNWHTQQFYTQHVKCSPVGCQCFSRFNSRITRQVCSVTFLERSRRTKESTDSSEPDGSERRPVESVGPEWESADPDIPEPDKGSPEPDGPAVCAEAAFPSDRSVDGVMFVSQVISASFCGAALPILCLRTCIRQYFTDVIGTTKQKGHFILNVGADSCLLRCWQKRVRSTLVNGHWGHVSSWDWWNIWEQKERQGLDKSRAHPFLSSTFWCELAEAELASPVSYVSWRNALAWRAVWAVRARRPGGPWPSREHRLGGLYEGGLLNWRSSHAQWAVWDAGARRLGGLCRWHPLASTLCSKLVLFVLLLYCTVCLGGRIRRLEKRHGISVPSYIVVTHMPCSSYLVILPGW